MANQAKVAQIYAELQLQTAQFKAALGEATGEMRKFSAQTRAEMREAKGAMAQLGEEIGIAMPRHVRSFVAELPGVAAAMNAAFDSVMVIGMIAVVGEAGKKIYEFVEKNEEAAKKNRDAWNSISQPIIEANFKSAVAIDKLNDEIAKLEHKPKNGLKDAVDEATLAITEMNKQLTDAVTKANELLEKQNANMFFRVSGWQTGNERLQHQQEEYLQSQSEEYGLWQEGLRRAGTPQEVQRVTQEHYRRASQQTTDYWNRLNAQLKELTELDNLQKTGEMSDFRFQLEQKYGSGRHGDEIESIRGLMGGVGALAHQQLNSGDLYDRSSTISRLSDRSADAEEHLQELQKSIDLRKALHSISLSEEALYWRSHLRDFATNSDQYLSVLQKYNAAEEATWKQITERGALAQLRKDQKPDTIRGNRDAAFGSIVIPDPLASDARSVVNQARIRAVLSEQITSYNLSIGKISANQAAIEIARAHAKAYDAALSELQSQYGEMVSSATDNRGLEQARRIKDQIDELQARRKVDELEDTQRVLNTTWTGMVDSVWDELIRRSQETEQQLAQIAARTIDALNDQFANGLTGRKMDFAFVFENAAHGLAKTGLEKIEGELLSGLGLGSKKRDGSAPASSLFVTMTNAMPDLRGWSPAPIVTGPAIQAMHFPSEDIAHNGFISGLMGKLNDSDWASSLFGGKLFGAGGLFAAGGKMSSVFSGLFSGLHFANGGDFPALAPITVGEMGPETVSFPVPGHVTSNRDSMGGGAPLIGYLDARGTDPALTAANVQRALRSVHARAVADASRAVAERSRRRPQ